MTTAIGQTARTYTHLSPDEFAALESDYEAVVAFWIRHALLPEERVRALVSEAAEDWVKRVQAVNGPLSAQEQEQHVRIYLGALASEFSD